MGAAYLGTSTITEGTKAAIGALWTSRDADKAHNLALRKIKSLEKYYDAMGENYKDMAVLKARQLDQDDFGNRIKLLEALTDTSLNADAIKLIYQSGDDWVTQLQTQFAGMSGADKVAAINKNYPGVFDDLTEDESENLSYLSSTIAQKNYEALVKKITGSKASRTEVAEALDLLRELGPPPGNGD